ncbi:hypothetical protein [Kitasatospora camelliae]|uniref:Uncharacterized protein n=1 Tax=Kitasatospora camelliae TaxID=3156397 RepID=A0AAU8JTJ1_9ACTN
MTPEAKKPARPRRRLCLVLLAGLILLATSAVLGSGDSLLFRTDCGPAAASVGGRIPDGAWDAECRRTYGFDRPTYTVRFRLPRQGVSDAVVRAFPAFRAEGCHGPEDTYGPKCADQSYVRFSLLDPAGVRGRSPENIVFTAGYTDDATALIDLQVYDV